MEKLNILTNILDLYEIKSRLLIYLLLMNIFSYINYDKKYSFAKDLMETPEYSEDFVKIIRDFFNENNLEIKYEIVGKKKDESNNGSEFFQKIENYFKGKN